MSRPVPFLLPVGAVLFCLLLLNVGGAAEIDFDTQVRPILSDHCFPCHGPDKATREAGLRLDTAEGAFTDLGGYAAFVPGDVEASEGLRRVFAEEDYEVMPPPEAKLALSDAEKATLRRWVQEGASWSAHWSFIPPGKPEVPKDSSGWARNPIDHFVLRAAREAGLAPAEPADRATLVRRLSLDLTGLPPTPEQVDTFLADRSERAYEKLVDRLLASPRYGERMAWEWLDAARYADTDGFQGDPTRTMWPWRDWLVQALNENLPFDQFTIELLAGDLLPEATPEQVLASGFNRNHMFNGEGGRIPEETRVENVFDRAETTGTVWMGLTMTCCRCHDHKYDPISQREYYQFYAFFNNTSETGRSGRGKTPPVLDYLPPERRSRREQLAAELKAVEAELEAPRPQLDQEQRQWEAAQRERLGAIKATITLGPWWQLGPIKAGGKQAFRQDFGPEEGVDLQAVVDGQRWKQRDDWDDGTVQPLPEVLGATYLYRQIDAPAGGSVQLSLGSDDAIKVFVNGDEVFANQVARAAAPDQERVRLELRPGRNELLLKIVNTGGSAGFYFKKTSESVLGLPPNIVAALRGSPEQRSQKQTAELRSHYRRQHWPQWRSLDRRRRQLKQQINALDREAVTVMVMDRLPESRRRQTRVLERGGYDKPTETVVQPGTPGVLPPPTGKDDEPADRLTLAKWLVSPDHPLTARVTVNRYWQTFFGRGLVESTEDFGTQGDRPTHPELLDWLAVRFIESGWNVKQMHKLMVMSATYRQSAHRRAEARQADPKNRYLMRSPRFRLPSWMLRDQALSMAGLLERQIGGPPVKTYQPEGIWAEATFGKIRYNRDRGKKLFRRSLYVFWRRIVGPTMFFDSAKRQTCEVKPTRTNTPLHALTTMNETTFVEAARQMARRVIEEGESDRQRVREAFRLATSRFPEPDELEILLARVRSLQEDFASAPEEAEALLAVGESPPANGLDPARHAAYTTVCSILLNLDETLTRP